MRYVSLHDYLPHLFLKPPIVAEAPTPQLAVPVLALVVQVRSLPSPLARRMVAAGYDVSPPVPGPELALSLCAAATFAGSPTNNVRRRRSVGWSEADGCTKGQRRCNGKCTDVSSNLW